MVRPEMAPLMASGPLCQRVKLVVEYDGTHYHGWQVQAQGETIQSCLERALTSVCGHTVRLHSSGRTDAGVHARGMCAHFDSLRRMPMAAYCQGVNRLLPSDIAVREACPVSQEFHARFDACGKWYRYSLDRSPVRSPLSRLYAWHLPFPLDLEAMRHAARVLTGFHDFAAFRSSSCVAKTTEREIFAIDFCEQGSLLHVDVRGSGFLKNMVRIIVGNLVEVGRDQRTVGNIEALLHKRNREEAGRTAPAHGLCLMEVWYEKRCPGGTDTSIKSHLLRDENA